MLFGTTKTLPLPGQPNQLQQLKKKQPQARPWSRMQMAHESIVEVVAARRENGGMVMRYAGDGIFFFRV